MTLTRNFKETIQERAQNDVEFRRTLLKESVQCMLDGDIDTGKAVLRDYINSTIGFKRLSKITDKPAKSLMRMFGPKGNPQAKNLFEVIACLQKQEHIDLTVGEQSVSSHI